MEKIQIRYRTWYIAKPPQVMKLEIPGWAGDSHDKCDGAKPQPWHCIPFVEGSTYGLELVWPFREEMKVSVVAGRLVVDCDWNKDNHYGVLDSPPIKTFAPGHYGITSGVDLIVPKGYVVRTEPHPSYFTDMTHSKPCVVPGHIQEWWSRIFFIVVKFPPEGYPTVYRYGEPFAQLLIVPRKVSYEIEPMTAEEKQVRDGRDDAIDKYSNELSEFVWRDCNNGEFNDKYKVLSRIFHRDGEKALDEHIAKVTAPRGKSTLRLSRRIIRATTH